MVSQGREWVRVLLAAERWARLTSILAGVQSVRHHAACLEGCFRILGDCWEGHRRRQLFLGCFQLGHHDPGILPGCCWWIPVVGKNPASLTTESLDVNEAVSSMLGLCSSYRGSEQSLRFGLFDGTARFPC